MHLVEYVVGQLYVVAPPGVSQVSQLLTFNLRLDCDTNLQKLAVVRRLVFVASNCLIANKVKNYNSIVVSKVIEKRKLKKFKSKI